MATYAVMNQNNVVQALVAADTVDGVELVFPTAKIVRVPENASVNQFYTYDETWEVFIPEGLVYEPISRKFMTPEEKAAL